MEQLCPFVSPGLLNESWNWFFNRWHLHQRVRLAILCRISFSQRPGQNFALHAGELRLVLLSGEAAPSDELSKWGIDVLCSCSPDRLRSAFHRSFFSQNHHRDWFEGLQCDLFSRQWWRRTPKGIWELCVCVCALLNKLLKWHKLTEVNYVFLNTVGICTLMNAAVQVN